MNTQKNDGIYEDLTQLIPDLHSLLDGDKRISMPEGYADIALTTHTSDDEKISIELSYYFSQDYISMFYLNHLCIKIDIDKKACHATTVAFDSMMDGDWFSKLEPHSESQQIVDAFVSALLRGTITHGHSFNKTANKPVNVIYKKLLKLIPDFHTLKQGDNLTSDTNWQYHDATLKVLSVTDDETVVCLHYINGLNDSSFPDPYIKISVNKKNGHAMTLVFLNSNGNNWINHSKTFSENQFSYDGFVSDSLAKLLTQGYVFKKTAED